MATAKNNSPNFSLDPRNWTPQQVCQFINWLTDELSIKEVDATQFRMSGVELCNLSKHDLNSHFPPSLVDILWMYLETLKFGMLNQPTVQFFCSFTQYLFSIIP